MAATLQGSAYPMFPAEGIAGNFTTVTRDGAGVTDIAPGRPLTRHERVIERLQDANGIRKPAWSGSVVLTAEEAETFDVGDIITLDNEGALCGDVLPMHSVDCRVVGVSCIAGPDDMVTVEFDALE